MKRPLSPLLTFAAVAPLLAAAATFAAASSATVSPGYVDLGTFPVPSSGGQFVEVNIGRSIISLVSRLAAKEEPEAARLLGQIESIRVNVVSVEDENREALTRRAAEIRGELEDQGWQKVVTAREDRQDVGIYLKMGAEDVILGVTVVVIDGNEEAVFVNVVGNIRPEDLEVVGDHLGLKPLKDLGLEEKQG